MFFRRRQVSGPSFLHSTKSVGSSPIASTTKTGNQSLAMLM